MQELKRAARTLAILPLLSAAILLGTAGSAEAANPLLCFDGTTDTLNGDTGGVTYGGFCTLSPDGKSALLDNSVPVPAGDYSGVYYATSELSGKLLGDITEMSFTYSGDAATAGSPRISLPIDTDNNGTTEFYAFISAFHCNDGAGLVDPINDLTCTIFYTGGPVSGDANWATFVAANPSWRVSSSVPFVVADDPGVWTVSNVHLGEGTAAGVVTAKNECKKGGWKNVTRADGSSFKNQGDCIQYVNTGK